MTKKYFRLFLSLGIILCVLCTSFTITTSASQWGSFEGPIENEFFDDESGNVEEEKNDDSEDDSKEASTTKTTTTTASSTTQPTTKPENTEKSTEESTKKPTKETTRKETKEETKATTKAPTKAPTKEPTKAPTKAPTKEPTKATTKAPAKTTTETQTTTLVTETIDPDEALLPEGAFFVYLERNNGERRLKFDLSEPSLVPLPNEPVRNGYIFKGWFADSEFKNPWDFSKSIAQKGTVIYAKWVPDTDTIEHKITTKKTVGGKIEVNPHSASYGEPIIITVVPDAGKRLVAGSITINGKNSDVLGFLMPREDVVVGASFEDIPVEIEQNNKSVVLPIIIAFAVLVVVGIIVAIIFAKYKARPVAIEYDENGAVILDDDDDDGWIDSTIVVENGFTNGKIIRESIDSDESDYETDRVEPFGSERSSLFETKQHLSSTDTEHIDE